MSVYIPQDEIVRKTVLDEFEKYAAQNQNKKPLAFFWPTTQLLKAQGYVIDDETTAFQGWWPYLIARKEVLCAE